MNKNSVPDTDGFFQSQSGDWTRAKGGKQPCPFRLSSKFCLIVKRRDGVERVEVTGRSAALLPVDPVRDPALKELVIQCSWIDNKESKTLALGGLCEGMKTGLYSRVGLRTEASLRPR